MVSHREEKKVNDQPKGVVVALQRGLDVLACFEPHNRELSHGELARLTQVPKPTLTRLLETLLGSGFLRLDPLSEKYNLGPRLVALSSAYVNSFDLRAVARPFMRQLARDTGLSVYLGIPSDLDMLVIETARAPSSSMPIMRMDVGSRVPMSTSSLGRAYLWECDEQARLAIMHRMAETHGEHWTHIHRALRANLQEGAAVGYFTCMGEIYPDVHSIGKALVTPSGDIVAFNCGGSSTFLTQQRIAQHAGPALVATLAALSAAIGEPKRYLTMNHQPEAQQ